MCILPMCIFGIFSFPYNFQPTFMQIYYKIYNFTILLLLRGETGSVRISACRWIALCTMGVRINTYFNIKVFWNFNKRCSQSIKSRYFRILFVLFSAIQFILDTPSINNYWLWHIKWTEEKHLRGEETFEVLLWLKTQVGLNPVHFWKSVNIWAYLS